MEILPPLPDLVPLPKPAGSQLPITASRKDNNRASRLPAERPLSPLSFKAKAIAAQPKAPKVHQWIVVPSKAKKAKKASPVAPPAAANSVAVGEVGSSGTLTIGDKKVHFKVLSKDDTKRLIQLTSAP